MTKPMDISAIETYLRRWVAQKEFEESLLFLGQLSAEGDRPGSAAKFSGGRSLSWEEVGQDLQYFFEQSQPAFIPQNKFWILVV